MMNVDLKPAASLPNIFASQPQRQSVVEDRWANMREVADLLEYDDPMNVLNGDRQFRRCRVKAGQPAFRMGQVFDGLYVVRMGHLKTTITNEGGSEHVQSFSMKGDLLGFDGLCNEQYVREATALTDCDLIRLPAVDLISSAMRSTNIERMAYWAISREVVREQRAYALSYAAKSEARVARFVRLQSERFGKLGYSPKRFTLSMTRRDIGSYLSVTLETVSRAFSALHHLGIIEVDKRDISIVSLQALREFEG